MHPFLSLMTMRIFWAFSVIVLRMLSLALCGETLGTSSKSSLEFPSELPCPDPDVISPCKCTFGADHGMNMDCSNVTSEEELKDIFSNDFSFTDFSKFVITNNQNITSLRKGDLGSATFKEIHIQFTSLNEIDDDAFIGSINTLVDLHVCDNSLDSVPVISDFTRLKTVLVWDNYISEIPVQSSTTLLELDVSHNSIKDVPENATVFLTALETLDLYGNSLTEIRPNTFTRNKNLSVLNLGGNQLTKIPDDAILLHGQNTYLGLHDNQITNFTYKAVSSVNGELDVSHNNLTEMPEDVFRPFLEDSMRIDLYDNPFKCGCDMAWLILNQTLFNRLPDLNDKTFEPSCYNKEKFTDLDPEIFKVMCPNATAVPL